MIFIIYIWISGASLMIHFIEPLCWLLIVVTRYDQPYTALLSSDTTLKVQSFYVSSVILCRSQVNRVPDKDSLQMIAKAFWFTFCHVNHTLITGWFCISWMFSLPLLSWIATSEQVSQSLVIPLTRDYNSSAWSALSKSGNCPWIFKS